MTNTQRSLVSAVGGAIAALVVIVGAAAWLRDNPPDQKADHPSTPTSTTTTAKPATTTPPTTSSTSTSTTTTTEVVVPAVAPARPPAPPMPRTAVAVVDNSVVLIDTRTGESSTLVSYPEPDYPEPYDTVRNVVLGPDGVVYYGLNHYEGHTHTDTLWRVSEGAAPELLVEGASSPALSRDGRRLAYATEPAEDLYLIAVRDLETGEEQSWAFSEGTAVNYLVPQGWAPDGRRLAYHFSAGDYGPLTVGVLDTKRDDELSADPAVYGPAYNVSWLDNERLLYDGGAPGLLLVHELSTDHDSILVDLRDGLGTSINYVLSASLDVSGRWILMTMSLPAEEYSESLTAAVYGPIGDEATFETLPFTVGYGGAAWR